MPNLYAPKFQSPFFRQLREKVASLGGHFNAHLHLDRYATLDDAYWDVANLQVGVNSHISLQKKHGLIHTLHGGPAFDPEDIKARADEALEAMVAFGTRRADTMVDVTADRVGHSALEVMLELKAKWAGQIELNCATYSPLGFKESEPERWEVFESAIDKADFIGALPEADDVVDYPDHIGFMEHCRRVLELAQTHSKMIHIHTDQRNEPSESGTERVVEAIRRWGAPAAIDGAPSVWVVHMVSPSTYDEARFQKLVEGLLEFNVGVICCPSAAVGMRQLRGLQTPTYNSIPRVLELIAAGVPVRLASDNIADICSPSTTADLADEVFVLSAAVRFYHVDILAKLAAGISLDNSEVAYIREHLEKNQIESQRVIDKHHM